MSTRTLLILLPLLLFPLWGNKSTASLTVRVLELQGIDISHHQKQIAWDSVVAARPDLGFAFVKATEGSDFCDSLFCQNWDALQRHGLRRGAYHFFRAYGCGAEQAAHFLQTVELQPGDFAPVLDIEVTDGMDADIMREEAVIWLQTVEHALGIRPIIYTNQNFYEKYLAGHFDAYPLWVARYSDERPMLASGKMWHLWQYSNRGALPGIGKDVDLDVFVGSAEMLEQLCLEGTAGHP